MIVLGCDEVSLSFGGEVVLNGLTFSVNDGDRLGIVGANGAGKTSLFRIITDQISYTGRVFISNNSTLGMLDQNPIVNSERSLFDEMISVFENKMEHDYELYDYKYQVDTILHKLGFSDHDFTKSVNTFSGGQKTRIALGKLLLIKPDILLLDEPTNHLDVDTLYWLEDYLASFKSTIIVISHDRYFLDKVATKILDIENGKGKLYNGNYSSYVTQKEKDREIQQHHYENQQREIKRLEEFITLQRKWNREHNIVAAESRQKYIDRMEKIDAPDAPTELIRLTFDAGRESGNDVLSVKKLSKSFGDKSVFENLNFQVQKGEFVFITGKNGSGKSTLMKILNGRERPTSGNVFWGANVSVGYYDQENQNLNPANTVLDEMSEYYRTHTLTQVRCALAQFLFKGDDVHKTVSVLSGGEKARLTLAKLILRKNNVLVLDEPTNHLDIGSKEALETALSEYKGTLIAVSHDRYFIQKLSTRMINISDYAAMSNQGDMTAYDKPEISESKMAYEEAKKAAADKRKLETAKKRALEQITKLETRLEEIDTQLHLEQNQTDYILLAQLDGEKNQIEDKLLELYELTIE
ncbi:MAG: ABC-F type ribosomal protection protein [Ruminococcaceae bacterium]|nr:ABC-F type ribosomal protection protein [Oscillospiraceae bacterium]